MRLLMIAGLLVALPFGANAAPTWQTISSEPGKRIELDRTALRLHDAQRQHDQTHFQEE